MALLRDGQAIRRDIPHEPGAWMTFRRLSTRQVSERPELETGRWADLPMDARIRLALLWVQACVVGWSYDEPCTPEACERLDPVTAIWAYVTAVSLTFGSETAEEKKADSPPSTPG
jgi:hypothetical protein